MLWSHWFVIAQLWSYLKRADKPLRKNASDALYRVLLLEQNSLKIKIIFKKCVTPTKTQGVHHPPWHVWRDRRITMNAAKIFACARMKYRNTLYPSFLHFPFETTNCYSECLYCSSYQLQDQVLGCLVLHKSKALWSGECPALNTEIITKQARVKDVLSVLLKNY